MKNFNEIAPNECSLSGKKARIADVVGERITIHGAKIIKSRFNDSEFALIQFELNDRMYILSTGSKVILRQIKDYRREIPFRTTIIKNNNCYTFS